MSVVDTVKGIYMSDGSMSTLLDFERCLDEADLYAFQNWIVGELVQGPVIGRYSCKCIFMWPYKLMPNPKGALRLVNIGCKVTFGKGEIDVPVEVKDYDDFNFLIKDKDKIKTWMLNNLSACHVVSYCICNSTCNSINGYFW